MNDDERAIFSLVFLYLGMFFICFVLILLDYLGFWWG